MANFEVGAELKGASMKSSTAKNGGAKDAEAKNGGVKKSRAKTGGMKIKHPKRRGEWAELRFMARAAEHGLQVTKPWGDSAHYDFGVENGGRFVRVQVKSTMHKTSRGYSCSVRACRGPYKGDAFDFVAAYLIPEDLWYIIPTKKILGRWTVTLHPNLEGSKLDCYKEAWHLLRKDSGAEKRLELKASCEIAAL